jgi:hypothetical protein
MAPDRHPRSISSDFILLVARDPDDDEQRILASVKSNLGPSPASLAFRLNDDGSGIAHVAWFGTVRHTADSLVNPVADEQGGRETDTDRWLRDVLADGEVAVSVVRSQAKDAGVPWRTVERSKAKLGVESKRVGYGEAGYWAWHLPYTATQTASPSEDDSMATFGGLWEENGHHDPEHGAIQPIGRHTAPETAIDPYTAMPQEAVAAYEADGWTFLDDDPEAV